MYLRSTKQTEHRRSRELVLYLVHIGVVMTLYEQLSISRKNLKDMDLILSYGRYSGEPKGHGSCTRLQLGPYYSSRMITAFAMVS